MNTTLPPVGPSSEILLRVQLGEILTGTDIERLSRLAETEGGLDQATTKALKAGLRTLTATPGKEEAA